MNNRPKRKASGYQTRYAKDDQSTGDKAANSEQVSKKEGEDPMGTILLDQGEYPEGKEYQYHKPDTDNCKEGITSTG